MTDSQLVILVLLFAIGGLIAVAYLLDQRRKKSGEIGPELPALGPVGKSLLWIARFLVAGMVLSIIAAIALGSLQLAYLTGGLLGLYIIDGVIFRIVKLTGK